jgi:hypothetical protein
MHACHINCIAGLGHFLYTSVIKQSTQIPFLLKVKIPTSYLLGSFFQESFFQLSCEKNLQCLERMKEQQNQLAIFAGG